MSNTNDHITEEIETNLERQIRETFEQLTQWQQQMYIDWLMRRFDSVPSYFERKQED